MAHTFILKAIPRIQIVKQAVSSKAHLSLAATPGFLGSYISPAISLFTFGVLKGKKSI